MPIKVEGLPLMARKPPPRSSNWQFRLTFTASSGRGTSQGSGRCIQLSGRSCCQPLLIDCLKMPYS